MPKTPKHPANTVKSKKRKRANCSEGKPKKPRNAWQIFYTNKRKWMVQYLESNSPCSDQSSSSQTIIPSKIVMKALGNLWHRLNPSEKVKYERIAREESIRYFAKLQELRKMEKPSRPKTAFLLFVDSYKERAIKEMAADNAGMNEILKHCSFKWQELHRDDKKPYFEKYKQALELYKVELEKYDAKTKLANTGQEVIK